VPNKFSLIKTNPSFTYPIPGYDAFKANTLGWLPPYSEVNKCTVLKAKAFATGYTPTLSTVATYFIDPALSNRYSMSVVSLSTDSMYLFADSMGIYVYGNDTIDGGNYRADVEVPGHVEVFELNGSLALSQHCGIADHGGGGRIAPQKSLKLKHTIYTDPILLIISFSPKKVHTSSKKFYSVTVGTAPTALYETTLQEKL